jgi:hypothetical protein
MDASEQRLDMLDIHQIFDRVWKHFIVDKNPPGLSNPSDTGCSYNGPDGPCAVGIFLRPEIGDLLDDATPTIEDILQELNQFEVTLFAELGDFLNDMQLAHDEAAREVTRGQDFYLVLKSNLRELAAKQGLTVPE